MFLFYLVFAMFARLFICAFWSPAGKGLTSWLSFVVSNCEFVNFPLVSWIRCGRCYRRHYDLISKFQLIVLIPIDCIDS